MIKRWPFLSKLFGKAAAPKLINLISFRRLWTVQVNNWLARTFWRIFISCSLISMKSIHSCWNCFFLNKICQLCFPISNISEILTKVMPLS
jgi:hypothetical protein